MASATAERRYTEVMERDAIAEERARDPDVSIQPVSIYHSPRYADFIYRLHLTGWTLALLGRSHMRDNIKNNCKNN